LYYGCFGPIRAKLADQNAALPGMGDTYQVTLPKDIISGRAACFSQGRRTDGLYIVFFAMCAGTIEFCDDVPAKLAGSTGLPIRCLDASGNARLRRFRGRYSSIYRSTASPTKTVVQPRRRRNVAFQVADATVPSDCVATPVRGPPGLGRLRRDAGALHQSLRADGDGSCPAIDVAPAIAQKSKKTKFSSDLFKSDVTSRCGSTTMSTTAP